jgi:hypothetical protein
MILTTGKNDVYVQLGMRVMNFLYELLKLCLSRTQIHIFAGDIKLL